MSKPQFVVIEGETGDKLFPGHVCFSADDSRIIGGIPGQKHLGVNCRLVQWDAETGKVLTVSDEPSTEEYCTDLKASPSGKQFAQKAGSRIAIRDAMTTKEVRSWPMPSKTVTRGLAWSSSGKLLAANSSAVSVWNTTSGEVEAALDSFAEPIGFLSEEPAVLLVGDNDGVSIWRTDQKQAKRVVKAPKSKGYCWDHALSPDGRTLISASEIGTLARTDTATWKTTFANGIRSSCGFEFAFAPDSSRVAITGSSGTLLVWDVVNHKPWLKWSKPNHHSAGSPSYSADGQRLALALDRRMHVLDFRPGAKAQKAVVATLAGDLHRCVQMVGGDERMDLTGGNGVPLNVLPSKCPTCRMPDLDHVSVPYLLGRGIEKPADLAPSEAGNFLVRESAKRILELVAPEQCRFVPTVHQKTKQPTHWFLAVPLNLQATATPPKQRERCPQCGEPWCFHHYSESQAGEDWASPASSHDVFKSRNWCSNKAPFKGWGQDRPSIPGRQLLFSVRLEVLFKKLKFRGLIRAYDSKAAVTAADEAWVKDQLARLAQAKTPASGPTKTDSAEEWFRQFLARPAKKAPAAFDFKALEKREGCRLPQSYQDFSAKIGRKKFADFQGEEGLDVTIWPGAKLDFDTFRNPDGDSDGPTRAVVFATLENGDSLCFDLSAKTGESPVFHYDHETDCFEPFAKTFADCVRQLAGD